jgi:hypothetical protein
MPVQTQLQQRRGTAASWTSTNPTLAAGEIGFESDTGKFKIGNGSTAWASLAYATNGAVVSPLTTKGDLFTYSTTNARLAVGANGETIVADSSTSTGLRYQANTFQNAVYNSAFDIWQRGTSFVPTAATNQYGPDRWLVYSGNAGRTISRQNAGNLSVSPNQAVRYAARVQRDSGNTSTAVTYLLATLETADSIPYAGKTITLSFYARAGANFSAASSIMSSAIRTGTGTDENTLNFTGFAQTAQNNTLTTSWQRFSQTVTLATTVTELGWSFEYAPVGTAGTNDWFEVTGVQVEQGSVATPYHRQTGTIQGELSAAQRYYYRTVVGGAESVYSAGGTGQSSTATAFFVPLPVPMRVTPTSVDFSTLSAADFSNAPTGLTNLTLNANNSSRQIATVNGTSASGITQYRPYVLTSTNTNGYVGFSAEL